MGRGAWEAEQRLPDRQDLVSLALFLLVGGCISLLIGAGALLGSKKALDLRRAAKDATN